MYHSILSNLAGILHAEGHCGLSMISNQQTPSEVTRRPNGRCTRKDTPITQLLAVSAALTQSKPNLSMVNGGLFNAFVNKDRFDGSDCFVIIQREFPCRHPLSWPKRHSL